jgi:uncharacterized protein YqeY
MSLKEQIVSDLTSAMKAKEVLRTSTLRMIKAALMNREIEKQGVLSDEEASALLRSLVKQRRDSVEQYEKGGRAELAEKELAEIAFIEAYLPQAATPEELRLAVEEAVRESGAASMREMGAVMKSVQSRLSGKTVDNRLVSELVKAKLSGS